MAKKGKREAESLLIAAQNNAIRTNHIKVRIDKTQQNSRFRLYGDIDQTIYHIISEYSKLAQKEQKKKKKKKLFTTGWVRRSTGNCART